jgi:hypothetical protein
VYDKKDYQITASTPKGCGCQDLYHAFTKKDGTLDTDTVEAELNRIETKIDKVYQALRTERPLTIEEWAILLLFTGLMYVRVPRYVSTFERFLSDIAEHCFEVSNGSPQVLKQLEDGGFPVKVTEKGWTADRGHTVIMSLDQMDGLTDMLSKMNWQFLKAPNDCHFITGDNPVSYLVPGRKRGPFPVALADEMVEVTFPLSKSICALGVWRSVETLYKVVEPKIVQVVNGRVAMSSNRYLYGPRNNPMDFCDDTQS